MRAQCSTGKFRPAQPRKSLEERARADADTIFKSAQTGLSASHRIRQKTHQEYVAKTNSSRFLDMLGSNTMISPAWVMAYRAKYETAFLERLVSLIEEADHGENA